MIRLLVADDDVELCELLQNYLSKEGFLVDLVHDGQQALINVEKHRYDLLILDVMMPFKNGFETLVELRRKSNLPVIMLTAKGEKVDRIIGLEMGADDYMAKPCEPRELVARIRAVTRRTHQIVTSTAEFPLIININNVSLDKQNREVKLHGETIEFTSTEFDLLNLLMESAGKLVSRDTISEVCLGKRLQPFDRSIDMHLSNVRKKLGELSPDKTRIKTIRGSGYQYLVWP